jgi:uncharacterized protein YoxC
MKKQHYPGAENAAAMIKNPVEQECKISRFATNHPGRIVVALRPVTSGDGRGKVAGNHLWDKNEFISWEIKSISQEMKVISQEMKVISREMKVISQEMKVISQEMKIISREMKVISQEMKTISREMKIISQEVKTISQEVKTISWEMKTISWEDSGYFQSKTNKQIIINF